MKQASELYETYLRTDMLPTILCSGCGAGVVLNATIRAIDSLKMDLDNMVFVSGIGCSSRLGAYINADSLHTTHGRAIAYATGVKAANPDLEVVVFTGDGDCVGIGGNHFIHGIRRNIGINVIAINNYNYGMTGGQTSPSTPQGSVTTTTQYGAFEHPFDIAQLAKTAGAAYVARWTTSHPLQLQKAIRKGFSNKGFCFIEVLSPCPTSYWGRNKVRNPEEMYQWYKDHTIPIGRAEEYPEKIPIGELVNVEKREWTEQWASLVRKVSP
ncbi:MAG: thiamine pyrophosphate-dependent enzyme [Candidatus Methanofastidiosa archaeon]|nr:2-oxoacid:ferredoxin oxidoreductase subunit beta [Candidatus Methanofastidiosa archaeon]MDD4282156.1 thiamine pyrophosphate-dependent enzyme [Candidatus Methanofastidiosa archaeon]